MVGCDSSIETEELALASFSACWTGKSVFNTWGAVLRREDHVRILTKTRPEAGGRFAASGIVFGLAETGMTKNACAHGTYRPIRIHLRL